MKIELISVSLTESKMLDMQVVTDRELVSSKYSHLIMCWLS